MMAESPLNLAALTKQRYTLRICRFAITVGLAVFVILLVLSHFLLDNQTLVPGSARYVKVELILGFSELAGLGLAAIALVVANVLNS